MDNQNFREKRKSESEESYQAMKKQNRIYVQNHREKRKGESEKAYQKMKAGDACFRMVISLSDRNIS